MTRKATAAAVSVNRISTTLQVGLWIMIVMVAFFMQAVPFFLVLTMFNLAVGVTSGVALILIPAAAFAMLSFACWIATRRTRNILPDPQPQMPQSACMAPYMTGGRSAPLTPNQRMVPILQRMRWRFY